MRFRPFKLLNASERTAIADLAGAALTGWREAWLTPPAPTAGVACGSAAERDDLVAVTDWLSFAAGRGMLHLADGKGALERVRNAIAGGAADAAAPADDSMEAGIVLSSLRDLVARLMGTVASDSDAAPTPETWLRGSGAAWVSLPLPDGDVVAVLDSALLTQLLAPAPRTARRLPALANPQQCIGNQAVDVRAWLGSTEIELAVFQTLAVNDVLLLDSRIDRPLRVTVAGREAVPRAVLGCAKQHKAMRLTTYSPID